MGQIGDGKSRFLDDIGGHRIGFELPTTFCRQYNLCSTEVAYYEAFVDQEPIYLVTIPGFHETQLSDVQVTQLVLESLVAIYDAGVLLKGFIYLHDVGQPRLTRSAIANLLMIQNMCGKDAYGQVVLVTTGWLETPTDAEAAQFEMKEGQLKSKYWDSMLSKGARYVRHNGSTSSAEDIAHLIVTEESFTPQAVDAYLIHRFLLDSVPKEILSHRDDGGFYLRHADNKGNHILVDDDYNIIRLLDWEWAHTDTKSAAFNSPVMLLPVAEFYDGNNQLRQDELVFAQLLQDKGHADLAEIVREGRILHQLDFGCGYDLADWEGFLGIFRGLRKALDVDGDLEWETWRGKALARYRDDAQLNELINRHE
ncbi:hypothetical protein TCE0_017f04421 [Talaromyces pinophilus]|uniref:Aminoglycoside phosphotransferase domain-containing protein n=1 Tax=Talaromyces pinophilus TaxID=128442 RepID=A0A6V8H3A6_TALPI|nr:hypothetical protein TCE0_017f04421 [Talaromyces pinophilus]